MLLLFIITMINMRKIKFCLTNEQFDKLLTPTSAQMKVKEIMEELMIPDVYHKLVNVCVYNPSQLRLLLSWGLKDSHCSEIGLSNENKETLMKWYEGDQSYKYNEISGGNQSMYVNIV